MLFENWVVRKITFSRIFLVGDKIRDSGMKKMDEHIAITAVWSCAGKTTMYAANWIRVSSDCWAM
jgi:hypothetical protein